MKTYACAECGQPLADLTPCTACDGTQIAEEANGHSRVIDYQQELARAVRMSGLPVEQIGAFEIEKRPSGRTRCIIWQWAGERVEKRYFYSGQKGGAYATP